MKTWFLILGIGLMGFLLSCSDDDPVTGVSVQSVSIRNLAADPATSYDPTTGAPSGFSNLFTFFRFSDSTIMPNSDSATGKWDIAFRSTTILVNSQSSGPGQAEAFTFNGLFSDLKVISQDSIFKKDLSPTELAIGKTWYNYDPVSYIISPKPGKVFVIKTNDNKYVKMEILSFYKDAPASPNAQRDPARYYTFRYVIQTDGSKKFE